MVVKVLLAVFMYENRNGNVGMSTTKYFVPSVNVMKIFRYANQLGYSDIKVDEIKVNTSNAEGNELFVKAKNLSKYVSNKIS